jgi:hypothetical protein
MAMLLELEPSMLKFVMLLWFDSAALLQSADQSQHERP